ncbi:MAG: DUF4956 domain-containing protein [Planctomycetes bacterium]|jgi:hypothetical protein|nr:DUF4956 domain-containing protein [Planctomycetota bacterium]
MLDMGDWLKATFPQVQDQTIAVDTLLQRLLAALVLGALVAIVYRFTERTRSAGTSSFIATLILLTVLLAMVAQVIGNSAALAFSLVGILSIVRFRTIVEDTRDTAFVIFAVVEGMAAGVGNLAVAVAGLFVVSLATVTLRALHFYAETPLVEWTLQLRVGTAVQDAAPWENLFAKSCASASLVGTATARQGAALDLTYKLKLNAEVTPMQFLNALNRLEGIQNLELKRT